MLPLVVDGARNLEHLSAAFVLAKRFVYVYTISKNLKSNGWVEDVNRGKIFSVGPNGGPLRPHSLMKLSCDNLYLPLRKAPAFLPVPQQMMDAKQTGFLC